MSDVTMDRSQTPHQLRRRQLGPPAFDLLSNPSLMNLGYTRQMEAELEPHPEAAAEINVEIKLAAVKKKKAAKA